jgi:death-on-curing protein
MESLVLNHPFIDGNKRVALVATGLFLERNGYTLEATQDEVYTFTMGVAEGAIDRVAIAAWLRKHAP